MEDLSKNDWRTIVRRVREGKLTPFISARLTSDLLPGEDAFPNAWAEFVGYPFKKNLGIPDIARFLIVDQGESLAAKEDFLYFKKKHLLDLAREQKSLTQEQEDILGGLSHMDYSELASSLGYLNFGEETLHPLYQLAQLDLPIYVTTNYFSLMELALRSVGKEPHAQICYWKENNAYSQAYGELTGRGVELADVLKKHFNASELSDLCFGLGIDYEELHGEGKSVKATELVKYLQRRSRLPELVKSIQSGRPDIDLSVLHSNSADTSMAVTGQRKLHYTLVQEQEHRVKPQRPLVYHLNGLDIEPSSLVLTEDDYLDLLVKVSSDQAVLPYNIRESLADTSLLLLGYDLQDWDFRVLFRGLITTKRGTRRGMSISIQLEPRNQKYKEEAKEYLKGYFAGLNFKIYWGRPESFFRDLSSWMEKYQ